MGLLDLALHLLGFALPALAVAPLVAGGVRLLWRGRGGNSFWGDAGANALAGLLALSAALWWYGRDGKMAAYAALAVAVATSQWACMRGWRGGKG